MVEKIGNIGFNAAAAAKIGVQQNGEESSPSIFTGGDKAAENKTSKEKRLEKRHEKATEKADKACEKYNEERNKNALLIDKHNSTLTKYNEYCAKLQELQGQENPPKEEMNALIDKIDALGEELQSTSSDVGSSNRKLFFKGLKIDFANWRHDRIEKKLNANSSEQAN